MMSTRLDLGKILFLILLFSLSCMAVLAGNLKGNIVDKETGAPLTGATVQVVGTVTGAVADLDGNYLLHLKPGPTPYKIRFA